jgi:hypothetical protein
MTTKEDLKTVVQTTSCEDYELDIRVSEILEAKGEVVAIVPHHAQYAIVAKYPKRVPHDIVFNIHDVVKEIRAVPETPSPREQETAQFTPRKHLRPETIRDREKLADALNPGVPCHHLIPAKEMALILLRAYQVGCDKSPVNTDTTNGMIYDMVKLISEYLVPWVEADVDTSEEAGAKEQAEYDRLRLENIKKARDLLLAGRK